jgi:hypothetical protein
MVLVRTKPRTTGCSLVPRLPNFLASRSLGFTCCGSGEERGSCRYGHDSDGEPARKCIAPTALRSRRPTGSRSPSATCRPGPQTSCDRLPIGLRARTSFQKALPKNRRRKRSERRSWSRSRVRSSNGSRSISSVMLASANRHLVANGVAVDEPKTRHHHRLTVAGSSQRATFMLTHVDGNMNAASAFRAGRRPR